jgi:curved DNA-binding protein CbpA
MSTCACGKPADTFGGFCGRCAALQTLGLGMIASPTDIEETYKTLVKVWHPDRFQTDQKLRQAAEEKLKEINAAHDYLTLGPPPEEARFVREESQTSSEPEEPADETAIPPRTQDEDPDEVKRVLRRYQKGTASRMLPRLFFALGGVAAIAFLWISLDALLSSNPKTQRSWEEFKDETSRDIHATAVRVWGDAADNLHGSKSDNASQPPEPAAKNEAAPSPKSEAKNDLDSRSKTPAKAGAGAKPYITSGLTPSEVLSVLGNPTSSSGEKVFYDGTEIDFRNGHVAGWKVDPKNPIRVKLWPDQALTPGLRAFALGSSKSDVIALQGTPTLFSENEFDYGSSAVYFKNDRVVGWKDDPFSVRLRTVAQ